ncbi:hypothetical protein B0H14DRAFT_2381505 [Mycena olivaceomarginata]|nr:hypothetical protein B0H14DRAFT_2381505 [Mycena olivaceomarginata]
MIYYHAGRYEEAKGTLSCSAREVQTGSRYLPSKTLRVMGNLASAYRNLGKFHKAEELEVVVLQKEKQVLGDDHPHTLQTMRNLALTFCNLGKFYKAEELQVVVLQKQKEVLGDDHPHTLLAMGSLASTYHCLGNFHKAEELQVAVLEKQKRYITLFITLFIRLCVSVCLSEAFSNLADVIKLLKLCTHTRFRQIALRKVIFLPSPNNSSP